MNCTCKAIVFDAIHQWFCYNLTPRKSLTLPCPRNRPITSRLQWITSTDILLYTEHRVYQCYNKVESVALTLDSISLPGIHISVIAVRTIRPPPTLLLGNIYLVSVNIHGFPWYAFIYRNLVHVLWYLLSRYNFRSVVFVI